MVLHIQALITTLAMITSVLMWVKGVFGASAIFTLSIIAVCYVTYGWLQETLRQVNTTKRHGLYLGAFGIGMFLFSYAMVPLYHILCHGSASLSDAASNHNVSIDVMVESYRSLPLVVHTSKKRVKLSSHGHEVVYFDLENRSGHALDIKLVIASNPRTMKPYFGLVTPDEIHLSPWQKTSFPVEIKFDGNIPEDLWDSALLFLFQDVNGVGELGKSNAWEKMHGKGYKDGVF